MDDPVDAVAIHGGGGLLGILAAPIFMENGKYPFFLLFEKEKVIWFFVIISSSVNPFASLQKKQKLHTLCEVRVGSAKIWCANLKKW